MSLSVSGYPHQGYPHPGPMTHEFYQYPQMARYPDHCEASYFQNWVLNGHHPEMPVSPDPYGGLPSPSSMTAAEFHLHYETYTNDSGERIVKRRFTANKKERRRTQSINTAFASLRGCIPNVPSDTKLSKIKTLRLATSYISYLMDVLSKDDPTLTENGFKAELTKKKDDKKKQQEQVNPENGCTSPNSASDKKNGKGRTGWPQHVWASELKQ